jgi:hypothetical protein
MAQDTFRSEWPGEALVAIGVVHQTRDLHGIELSWEASEERSA